LLKACSGKRNNEQYGQAAFKHRREDKGFFYAGTYIF
jgi:hypothetical protein